MPSSRLLSLLTVALLAISSFSSTTVDAKCAQPRVRYSWTALSADEVQLYKDALAMAMDTGAYATFGEIHYEMMSEAEAHGQCMFIYWHRYFVVAFENMLRAQDPRFECVTIPYWDWMSEYERFATGQCSDVLECSPTLQILGGRGPKTTEYRNYTVNGVVHQGFCATEYPMDHFCETTLVSKDACMRCVPRDDWTGIPIPAVASYPSVRAQLFNGSTIGVMSRALEEGAHNNMHGILGSMMGTINTHQAPGDPVFWSHHSMIDMLHATFHKCRVGEQKMTFEQKAASAAWASCERRTGGVFQPTDQVTVRSGYMGQNPVDAVDDPIVGKFFAMLPRQYAALVDIRDLGESSYSYAITGPAAKLFTQCGADGEDDLDLDLHLFNATNAPIHQWTGPARPSSASGPPPMSQLITASREASSMDEWVRSSDELVASLGGNAILEAEKMACLFQDECLGGVSSYTKAFKEGLHLTGEPRCNQIVAAIHANHDAVTVADWKERMMEKLGGCPKPKQEAEAPTTVHPAAFRG